MQFLLELLLVPCPSHFNCRCSYPSSSSPYCHPRFCVQLLTFLYHWTMTPRSLTGYSAVPGQGLLQIISHHGPVLISLLRVPFLCTEGIDCKLSWVNKSATDLLDTTVRAHWYLWHVKAYPNAPSISKISIIPRLQTTHSDCFQFKFLKITLTYFKQFFNNYDNKQFTVFSQVNWQTNNYTHILLPLKRID